MKESKTLTWDIDVKILTNRIMMRQISLGLGIPLLLLFLLISALMLIDGSDLRTYFINMIPFIYILVGFAIITILIIFVFFSNIYPYTFILNDKMAIMSTRKEHRKKNNKVANILILMGILSTKPGVVSLGVMNKSNYSRMIRYSDIKEIIVYHKSNTVILKGQSFFDKCYLYYEEDRLPQLIDFLHSKLRNRISIQSR